MALGIFLVRVNNSSATTKKTQLYLKEKEFPETEPIRKHMCDVIFKNKWTSYISRVVF